MNKVYKYYENHIKKEHANLVRIENFIKRDINFKTYNNKDIQKILKYLLKIGNNNARKG